MVMMYALVYTDHITLLIWNFRVSETQGEVTGFTSPSIVTVAFPIHASVHRIN